MPAVGECRAAPWGLLLAIRKRGEGPQGDIDVGEKNLQVLLFCAAVLAGWAGGDGAALSWGRAGAAQGSRGEGWGGLEQRGGAQQGGGRNWQAQCG
jgi:hypothetical protein